MNLIKIGQTIRGTITGFLFLLNIAIISSMIFLLIPISQLFPSKNLRKQALAAAHQLLHFWADINKAINTLIVHTRFDITYPQHLNPKNWYLVVSNHRSWADAYILYTVFNRRIPFLKFLTKQELLWIPIIGQTCWLLGFPFLKRYSKKQQIKNLKLHKKDIQTTQKACDQFRQFPTSVMIFAEGTRYSIKKATAQNSPYKHLLKPRAGGIANILRNMNNHIGEGLDVTIIYPDEQHCSLWDYFCGRIKKNIIVDIKKYNIPKAYCGDYQNDPQFRAFFQNTLNNLWKEKDELIEENCATRRI